MNQKILEEDFERPLDLVLNRYQYLLTTHLPRINSATSLCGRGTGKSSVIAFLMRMIVQTMPRSMWVIQGHTYQHILSKTIPSTLSFLEKIGFKKDIDYFIHKYPPKGYELPFEAPATPENCIFFINKKYRAAVGFSLFSQDRSSSRGANRDGVICDESLMLDWDKFTTETLATNRGNNAYFSNIPYHHGVFHFSSMPTGDSKLFDDGQYYKNIDIRGINDKRIDLQLDFMLAKSVKERLELWAEIDELSRQLKYYPSKKGKLYLEFNTFDNIEHLGISYIQKQFDSMTIPLFLVEILNKRVTKIEGSFYANLDKRIHGYTGRFNYEYLDTLNFNDVEVPRLDCRQDADCISTLPLHVGMDFGSAINWFVTAQHIKGENKLNFIKNHYVKSPKIIDDVANEWCDYYQHHPRKTVYLYPGADGLNKQPNVKGQQSYVELIKSILRKRGWSVAVRKVEKYEYAHHEKYLCWARALSQGDKRYPSIGINLVNCKELYFSMEQTPAKDHGGKIQKDKSSERKLKENREQATDGGDAADQILFGMFGHLNKNGGVAAPITQLSI